MKKFLFLALAVASLYFFGCQGSEHITDPGELDKIAALDWGNDPVSIGDLDSGPLTVDLIAGQFYNVGEVKLEKSAGGIKISYIVDAPDGYVSEIHVDLASTRDIWSTTNLTGFHVNKNGNPQFGQFDSKNLATVNGINSDLVTVTFLEPNLKTALGVESLTNDTKFYIAVHGVVTYGTGIAQYFCPETQNASLYRFSGASEYYHKYEFLTPVIDDQKIFYGWCLDASRFLHLSDCPLPLNFLCSYNLGTLSCVVDKPENLDLANWIINNKGSYTKFQIQGAIWHLLSNSTAWYTLEPDYYNSPYMEVVNAAIASGEGFVPTICGQKVLIIGYNQEGTNPDPCLNITKQVIAFEVDAECSSQSSETAMGFNAFYDEATNKWYPVSDKSTLFPNHVWFRYFSFNW